MKTESSPYAQAMSAAKRQYDKLGKQMQTMRDWYDGGNIEASYEASVQAEKLSEKLTLLMRVLPAYTGNPRARFDVEENIAQTIPVEIGQWLAMEETIPEEGLPITDKPCWMV